MEPKIGSLVIWSGILILLFLGSLILYITDAGRMDFRVIFFPDESAQEWRGEERKVPHHSTPEEAAHALIKEIILGPAELRLARALPKDTYIRSVLLRNDTLFVDFSEHPAEPEGNMGISFEAMLEGVRRTVLYNFPSIERVVVFIGGIEAG